MQEKLTAFWADLDPTKKRLLTLVTAGVFVMGLLFALVSKSEPPPPPKRPQEIVRHPLTGKKSKSLDMDALAGELQRIQRSMQEMQEQTQLYIQQAKRDRKGDLTHYEEKIARNNSSQEATVARLQGEIDDLRSNPVTVAESSPGASGGESTPTPESSQPAVKYQALNASEWERLLAEAERNVDIPPNDGEELPGTPNVYGQDQEGSARNGSADSQEAPEPIGVHIYGEDDAGNGEKSNASALNNAGDDKGTWLSAGSIFSGVLLNGLDAPTGNSAKQDPFPVVVRLKQETIMPNYFSMDLEECFLTATGFGDLSSERAFFRAERLSCIRTDGVPIEQKIEAAAIGPDGKTGVRGRLIERNGQLIAMSIMAGSLSGLSEIFRPVAITTVNTSPDDDTLFQTPDRTEAAKAGAASGVSKALEKIAEYYLERADAIYPLIQVDAGISIDFMVLQGSYIKPKATTNDAAVAAR